MKHEPVETYSTTQLGSLINILDLMGKSTEQPKELIAPIKYFRDVIFYTVEELAIVPTGGNLLSFSMSCRITQEVPDVGDWSPPVEVANYFEKLGPVIELFKAGIPIPEEMEREITGLAGEVNKLLNDIFSHEVMGWAMRFLVYKDLEVTKAMRALEEQRDLDKKGNQLFANSDAIRSDQFLMPQFTADSINQFIKDVTPARMKSLTDAIDYRTRPKTGIYKVSGRREKQQWEKTFTYDPAAVALKNAEKIVEKLLALKNPKVLQTFFALWKWAGDNKTNVFDDVPISEIMGLVLKPGEQCKFNKEQRKEFSSALLDLASITITETIIGERKVRGGRSKTEMRERTGVRLFNLEATYSVKKEFQDRAKEDLDEAIHFDKTVITRFRGELMPDSPDVFSTKGRVYSNSLLGMDANKDGRAIIMGFHVQTRFSQFSNKEQYIDLDRAFLVNLCDYQTTNATKPAKATQQIVKNLDKLVSRGIISRYSRLGNGETDRVKIYPPVQQGPELLD